MSPVFLCKGHLDRIVWLSSSLLLGLRCGVDRLECWNHTGMGWDPGSATCAVILASHINTMGLANSPVQWGWSHLPCRVAVRSRCDHRCTRSSQRQGVLGPSSPGSSIPSFSEHPPLSQGTPNLGSCQHLKCSNLTQLWVSQPLAQVFLGQGLCPGRSKGYEGPESTQPSLSPLEDSSIGVYRVQTTHLDHSPPSQGPNHP